MVSWGTTTNVSVPVDTVPVPPPASISISRGALGGHLLEAGLSASGAAIGWLCNLTGRDLHGLTDAAAASPSGARGVVALPWLHGARAPWWRPGARAAFLGLTGAHGPGDLARAFYEAVAFDVARSLERLSADTAGFVALCVVTPCESCMNRSFSANRLLRSANARARARSRVLSCSIRLTN